MSKRVEDDTWEEMLDMVYLLACETFEKTYLTVNLNRFGTISHAAEAMGISRKHLHTLINKHGIVFKNGSVRS